MIELNGDGFESNISVIKTEFRRDSMIDDLNCLRDVVPAKYDDKFVNCCLSLIEEAHLRVCGEYFIRETNIEKLNRINKCMTNISKYLSFSTSEQAAKGLLSTPYINEDFIFNILTYTYYALVLIDKKIYRRFEVAYTLWQHSVKVGMAGYSEKFNRFFPYYVTYFGNKIFLVNPIEGWVKAFKKSGKLRKKKINGILTGVINDKCVVLAATSDGLYVPLIEGNTFFGLKEIQPAYLAQKDTKKSERKKKRERGLKSKEKPWLTTTLDKIDDSTFTIKTHSMIALMVYGLEVMKYGVMEGNSIFTIDHINGIHNDNNIENLQLLTRISNDKKRNKPQNWYLDYFIYWDTRVRQARINQEYLDFRRRI